MRTSLTHPLRIDHFDYVNGRIGLTFAPGKCAPSASGPAWRRDLTLDVAALKTWGADVVITALTKAEISALNIPHLGKEITGLGMEWLHLPLEDGTAPTPEWWEIWHKASPRLHRMIEEGKSLVFHCKGGVERAPMIAALFMMERGISLPDAATRIQAVRSDALPTAGQLRALQEALPPLSRRAESIRAMMHGGALGDAMGAEIEFWSLAQIKARFPNGIDQLIPHQGKIGAITDDTQMSLFTAEGLIRAKIRGVLKGVSHPASVVHHALQRWMKTQGEMTAAGICEVGLVTDTRLHARRAPGLTCLSALRGAMPEGGVARNNSKGCGTIMRVGPMAFVNVSDRSELARQTSALTHGHSAGIEAAVAFANILGSYAEHRSLNRAILLALQECRSDEVKIAILNALQAPTDGKPETVEALGGGWVAEEALAIAIYAARCARDLDHGLQIALIHSGDSDSTGAIAGNLLGLMFPEQVRQHALHEKVECADLIERIARDLEKLPEMDSRLAEAWFDRYPGW